MESSLKNMVVTLLVITLVSASAVGFVYKITAEPIARAKAAKITAAIALVLPTFDNDPGAAKTVQTIDGKEVVVYTATQGQDTVGYAVETFTNTGFGGEIKLNARSGQQNRTQQIRLCRAVRRQKSGRLQTGGAQGRRGCRRHHRFDDLFARLQRRRESGLRSLQIDPKQRKP